MNATLLPVGDAVGNGRGDRPSTSGQVAHEAQREAHARLELALDAAGMATWQMNLESRALTYSEQMGPLFGRARGFQHSSVEAWAADVYAEDRDAIRNGWLRAAEGDDASLYRVEYRAIGPDRRMRWIASQGRIFRDERGAPSSILGVALDETERRVAQIARDAQARALELATGGDLPGALDVIADAAREGAHVADAGAALFVVDLDQQRLRVAATSRMPSEQADALERAGADAATRAPAGGASFPDERIVVRDVPEDSMRWQAFAPLARRCDIRACWSFPIRVEGARTRGALVLCLRDPLEPSATDCRRLQQLASTAALVIERQRQLDERRRAEARYRAVIDASASIVWRSSPDGHMLERSGWEEFTGQCAEDVGGHGWRAMLHPDDAVRASKIWQAETANGGRSVELSYRLRHASGTYRWVLVRGAPLRNAAGAVTEWIGTITDVHEQRVAQDALVALANSVPVLVWRANRDGGIEFVNQQWCEYTGQSEEQARGDGWIQVVHPDDLEPMRARWYAAIASSTIYEIDYRIRRHDGVYRWFKGRAIAQRGADGDIDRWFGSCTDVEDAKVTEALLREQEAALRLADRRKDEFLATLAHELRNPMAPIRYAAAMLGPETPTATREQARLMIQRQAAQMSRLLDDLLDMSRITRDRLELKRETLDLRRIVNEVVDAERASMVAARQRIAIALPAQPCWVSGDATRLAQVFGNLLNNAVKYTPAGGDIALTLEREPREDAAGERRVLRLSITDTGLGLSAEMLPRLFELFAQLHKSIDGSKGGLGIGLAVVRRLVELHGGTIEARSEGLGRGATFTVRLPEVAAPRSAEAIAQPAITDAATQLRRVLVVDDNEDAAESLAMLLRMEGLPVHIAVDGRGALALADSVRPDVVVLDIGLPDISGAEVARQLRQRDWARRTRLIAVTGWGQPEDRRRTQEAGFDVHLVKPVDPDQLLAVIGCPGAPRAAPGRSSPRPSPPQQQPSS